MSSINIIAFNPQQLNATEYSRVTSEAGFELLCTYSWTTANLDCSIYVSGTMNPYVSSCWFKWWNASLTTLKGAPPKLCSKELPLVLPRDQGTFYIDHNASRVPKFPFEPLFRALQVMDPSVDFSEIDVVTDRNSLRKLFNFVAGKEKSRSFRIGLAMVHNTLFLTRQERRTLETLRGTKGTGFGHNFERAISVPDRDLENSSSHHRVIRYALGNLKCVVRFEVDAAIASTMPRGPQDTEHDDSFSVPPTYSANGIAVSVERMSLDHGQDKAQHAPEHYTHTIPRGCSVPSSTIAEIKTVKKPRNPPFLSNNHPPFEQNLPQLWFGRTPYLVCGFHLDGSFTGVDTIDVSTRFQSWEEKHQESLQKTVDLTSRLQEITVKSKGGCCVAVYNSKLKSSRRRL
jgi:hypothetical protein